MMMKRVMLALLFLLPAMADAAGSYLVAVSARLPNGGWSRESFVQVSFLSGWELRAPDLNGAGTYAEWSGPGNPGLAEIQQTRAIPRAGSFHDGWISILFTGRDSVLAVEIDSGREWRIRAIESGAWIDPKLNRRR